MNKALALAALSPLGVVAAVFAFLLCTGPAVLNAASASGVPQAASVAGPGGGSAGGGGGGGTWTGQPTLTLPDGGKDGLPVGFTLPVGTPPAVVIAEDFAASKLGMAYQWGGEGDPSYDCSGLMQAAYAAAGLRIARTTYDQVSNGVHVDLATIAPGDLVFIPGSDAKGSLPGHVGMFLGSWHGVGYVIQAPYTGTVIQAGPLADWVSQISDIRRIDVNGV